jgi:hypothetical protein
MKKDFNRVLLVWYAVAKREDIQTINIVRLTVAVIRTLFVNANATMVSTNGCCFKVYVFSIFTEVKNTNQASNPNCNHFNYVYIP